MKKHLLMKTLLVALVCLVGGASSVWGEVISFSATNRITNNGNGTFTTASNAGNQYALAIADLSGITGITGENKFITIEFDTNIPSGSRWLVGIGDKTTRGTTANGSSKSTYNTDGLVCRFGTSDGTSYRVNGGTSYSLFDVSVHATFTLNKRLGTYSLVLHNNSTDTDVYTASGTSTTVANATIVELYSWVNSSTVTVSDVTVTVKDTYEYSVNAVDGSSNKLKTLKTGNDVSGATVYYAYPRYINVNGTLYKKDKGSGTNHYESSFTLSSGGDKNVTYAASSYTNVVYFAEGEDVLTLTTNGGNTSRCSMMASGRAASATKIVTLPAGSYNINMAFFAASGKHFYAYKGSESDANKIYEYEGTGSWKESGQSAFTLTETTDILVKGGDSNNGIDYIIITGTPTREIVGAVDMSTDANAANSQDYTLRPGDSMKFTFKNHGTTYGNNWRISVKEGSTWKANVCADSYDYTADAATKTSYTMSTDGGSSKVALNWDRFAEDMADATVEATLNYGVGGTLELVTTSTGAANGYIYYVDQDVTGLTAAVTVNLSVNHSWLEILSATESVTVTSAGYATYVPSNDLDFSTTEIEAYKVKVTSKGVATLTKVNNVPAGTPVLLYKDGGDTENIPVMTGAAAVSDNDLVAGTDAAVATTDGG